LSAERGSAEVVSPAGRRAGLF